MDILFSPPLGGCVRFESCSFSRTRRIDKDLIKKVRKQIAELCAVQLHDGGIVTSCPVEVALQRDDP